MKTKTINISKWVVASFITLLMMLLFFVTADAAVYGGTAKGTKWSVDTDSGVLTIDVDGPMGSWTQGSQPWYKYRSEITSIAFENATSKITNYAFSDLVAVEIIEIPNSIEEIGDQAFLNCSSATKVYIPISVTTWGGNVFQGCTDIEYIFTENQTNISMTAPIWDSTVGSAAVGGVELQIESKSIGRYAFYGLSTVTNVKLPTTLTTISDYAFYGFTSPFELNLVSATKIGNYAFYHASGVTKINLPAAKSVGEYAFQGCTAATEINLPVATSIGRNAFENCTSARKITVGASDTVTYGTSAFAGDRAVTELYLGNINFTSGSNALSNLGTTNGVTVTLGKSISSISGTLQSGYIGTTGAMTLVLEEGSALSSVAASAFKNNTILVSVDLSNSDKNMTLGTDAFSGCSSVRTFITGTGTLSIGTNSLYGLVNCEKFTLNSKSTSLSTSVSLSNPTTSSVSYSASASSYTAGVTLQFTDLTEWRRGTRSDNNTGSVYYSHGDYCSITPTKINSAPSSVSATVSSVGAISYSLTYTHPLTNLGKNNGCDVTIGPTVETIPNYMFSSGIAVQNTSTAQISSPASHRISVSIAAATSFNVYSYAGYYGNNGFSERTRSVSAATVYTPNKSYTISASNKTTPSYTNYQSSGINVRHVNVLRGNLSSIGKQAFAREERTANVNVSTTTTTTITSTSTATHISPSSYHKYHFTYNNDSYPTTMTFPDSEGGTAQSISVAASSSTSSSYTATWSITSQSTSSATLTDSSSSASSSIISVNLGAVSKSGATIEESAFANNPNLEQVYIGSGVTTINTNAFYAAKGTSVAYIYGKTANTFLPSSNNGLTSEGNNGIGTINYMPNAKDYGIYIATYAIGTNANAFLYNTQGDDYLIYISGTGTTNNYSGVARPGWDALYGDKITEIVVDNTITSLGNYLFYGHTALTNVSIGNGVTTFGSHLFDGAELLSEMPTGNALTALGDYSLANTAIESVTIPTTITTLGAAIFSDCPITSVTYSATSASNVTAATRPFSGFGEGEQISVTISNNVTSIPAYAFYECNATTVNIGSGVETIGEGAFSGMPYATIDIAEDNTNFQQSPSGNGDLYKTDGTTLVTYLASHEDENYAIPESTSAIAAGAFYGQNHLTQVSFGGNIVSVGANAFAAANNLETICISDFMDEDSFDAEVETGDNWSGSATVIYSGLEWDIGVTRGAMSARLYSDGTLIISGSGGMKNWASANNVEWASKRTSITNVVFIGDITTIGQYAFYGCENLETINLPKALTSIGQFAFYGCSSLQGASIPDGVKTINTYTFGNCTNIGYVDTGNSVTTIEPFAFAGSTNAKFVVIGGNVSTIKANAFKDCRYMSVIIVGKKAKTDFIDSSGAPEVYSAGSGDVFRVSYLYDISEGVYTERYPGNATTKSKYAANPNSAPDLGDVWGYGFDTDGDDKTDYLFFSGRNSMELFADKESVYWNGTREDLKGVVLEDDVMSVAPYAFLDCDSLEFVRIGKGCQAINTQAFKNCTSLKEIYIDAQSLSENALNTTAEVFANAGSTDGFDVIFEDNAQTVSSNLFYGCENVSSITLGESINRIKGGAFAGATALKSVYIKCTNILNCDNNVFVDAGKNSGGFTVEIAANVTKIPSSIFYAPDGVPYVTSVVTDSGSKLTEIASSAFKGCNHLESVSFAGCTLLTTINTEAFNGCTRLNTVDLSNCVKLTTFGNSAFNACINLSALNINNDEAIRTFSSYSFNNCKSIPQIVLPASVATVDSYCFGNWEVSQIIYALDKNDSSDFSSSGSYWNGSATVIYSRQKWDVTDTDAGYEAGTVWAFYCPDDLGNNPYLIVSGPGPIKSFETASGNWQVGATDYASRIKNIVINDSVTGIGDYAFANMTNAKSLSIGSGITYIGDYAFQNDAAVPEADLSKAAANITSIGRGAFENCSGISTVNLSGIEALSFDYDAFKNLSGASVIYVTSDYIYDELANTNGNIKSTYGTTVNTKISMVRVTFSTNLTSMGVYQGNDIAWHVETAAGDGGTTFRWYFATDAGSDWTEITNAMTGYNIVSTANTSDLYMDGSIVTLDKNGYYYRCDAISPYYNAKSNVAILAVYSAAITPTITVTDKNGDALDSNTWTQGPVTIHITKGEASNGRTPTYQYKLKASGSWRNTADEMTYNTEGIVTLYVRAIINGDANTASTPVTYILKIDNTAPNPVNIVPDPAYESTDSVKLTATATDNTSGVRTILWYKTAADASGSGVTGYVPLVDEVDMNTMVIAANVYTKSDGNVTKDEYTTTYTGKNETHNGPNQGIIVTGGDTALARIATADSAVDNDLIEQYKLYEVHVGNGAEDYEISADNKGVITLPVPEGFNTNLLSVYGYNANGNLTPITNFTLEDGNSKVTFSISYFGYYVVAEKPAT